MAENACSHILPEKKITQIKPRQVKVNVKSSPCFFNRAPRYEGVLGNGGKLHGFLTSALDRGGWSASRPGRLPPGKELLVPIE